MKGTRASDSFLDDETLFYYERDDIRVCDFVSVACGPIYQPILLDLSTYFVF